jgi:hypothetical protein
VPLCGSKDLAAVVAEAKAGVVVLAARVAGLVGAMNKAWIAA